MWGYLIRGLIFALIANLLRPKPKPPEAATFDDVDIPLAQEGQEIGKVYGTVRRKTVHVVWYGDFASRPITQSQGKK